MRFITKKQLAKIKKDLKKNKVLIATGVGLGSVATVGGIIAIKTYKKAKKVNTQLTDIANVLQGIEKVKKNIENSGKILSQKHSEGSTFIARQVKKGAVEKEAKEKRKDSLILPGAFPD